MSAVDFMRFLSRIEQVSDPQDIFDLARQQKFDGPVTFHFQGGVPRAVEAGRPVHIPIVPIRVLTRTG